MIIIMKTTFDTVIQGFGNNAGIMVPPENIAALSAGKKPPVKVTIANYSYENSVAVMGGKYMISLSKAHREASGIAAGDKVTVTLELIEGVREVAVPKELQAALEAAGLEGNFEKLAYSKRKECCRQVTDAKAEDTRERRIAKIIASLRTDR
jgi:hypothetical protein